MEDKINDLIDFYEAELLSVESIIEPTDYDRGIAAQCRQIIDDLKSLLKPYEL